VKNKLGAMLLLAATALLPGCRSNSKPAPAPVGPISPSPTASKTASSGDEIIARVGGVPITRRQLEAPLLESYGLPMLLNIIQLDLAREQVRIHNLHVSSEDIRNERSLTLTRLFPDATPDDYETLLDQLLNQRRVSRADFDLTMETNANLRKLAEPMMAGKITDAMIHQAFGELYGENRQIRDIELSNMREIAEAKRRLDSGEPFEKVAREMSRDTESRSLGGELPPFSALSPNVPKAIKEATFSLPIGQVSDPLQDGDEYHLIVVDKIIPPKIAKFDEVKDDVRKQLEDKWMDLELKVLRQQLGQLAMQNMVITDPILQQKWQEMKDQATSRQQGRDEVRAEIAHNHPATEPAAPAPPATNP